MNLNLHLHFHQGVWLSLLEDAIALGWEKYQEFVLYCI